MKKFLTQAVVMLVALPMNAWSAEIDTTGSMLTVDSAIEIATANNPALNQMRERISARKGTRWASAGIDAPRLSYFKEGLEPGPSGTFNERRWTISQSLDFPLTSYYRVRRISQEVHSLQGELDAEILIVTAEVKKSYTSLAHALELIHLATQQVQLAEQLQNAAATRYEVGEASELDLMKADIQLAEAQNDLGSADRALHQARYALFKLIGLDPDQQTYSLGFPDTLAYFEADIDQDAALHRLEHQPAYRSARFGARAAQSGVREAWSGFLPDIDFSYYSQDYGGGFDFRGFELGLKLPVWFMLNRRGKIQEAKAVRGEREWQQRRVFLDLKKQAEDAWHGYESNRANIERFHRMIRPRARSLSELTLEGYQAGELDLLTLLEAQRTLLQSERSYFDALRDYYFTLIEMEKFVGYELVFK